jgi:hypothetical protein
MLLMQRGMSKEIWCEGLDWIHLAQDTVQWWTFLTVGFHTNREFLDQLSKYQLFKEDPATCSKPC